MKPPKNPELSFLIRSLCLDPNEFFCRVQNEYRIGSTLWKCVNSIISTMTYDMVGNIDLHNYTPEIVDAWSHEFNQKWKPIEKSKGENFVFQHVKRVARECIAVRDYQPCFKIEKIEKWQSVSFFCGEDLFVAALLADESLNNGYEPSNYQWDYILKSDFRPLNDMIEKYGLVENHSHLGGSQPMVDVSWIYLMNYPFGQTELFHKFEGYPQSFYATVQGMRSSRHGEMEHLVQASALIRLWLYNKIYRKGVQDTSDLAWMDNMSNNVSQLLDGRFSLLMDIMNDSIELYRFSSPFMAYERKVDYAITSTPDTSLNNSYITGERCLIYSVLKKLFSSSSADNAELYFLFYLYLLIRHKFNKMFVQQNNKAGFQNFKEYTDRTKVFILSSEYYYMAQNMAIEGNIKENNLCQLELRTNPKNNSDELRDSYFRIDEKAFIHSSEDFISTLMCDNQDDAFYNGTEWFFYVMHFTKEKNSSWYEEDKYKDIPLCREWSKRELYKKQAQVFHQLREDGDPVCERIFGIDGASNEVNFRPETFGPVFRYLAASKGKKNVYGKAMPDLRRTYHVGEDFYDIIDGLRAIDEAVLFLELGQGDRIGHGVVLGIDVDKWYQVHQDAVSMPKQNKLDNLAWMLYKVREWNIDVSTATYERINTRIERLFHEIHGYRYPGLLAYHDAWLLRGDDPDVYSAPCWTKQGLSRNDDWEKHRVRDRERYEKLKNEPMVISISSNESHFEKYNVGMVYKLYHDYHYDAELKRRAKGSEPMEFWPEYIDLAKKLQIYMRSFILNKGVGVESCPSSNFLISNLEDFREIPTFNLFPIRESQSDFVRLNVCINTDDQGVFYTSLTKEYAMLVGTLRQYIKEGVREYSDDEIMTWIEKLIDNGKMLCFREVE